jgi:hypothetical protein
MTTIYNNKYDIDSESANDQSGYSVSMNSAGDIVAIGARHAKNDDDVKIGHVRVYKQIDGKWEQLGIDIDGESADDNSGWAVSMNSAGDIVAIGAPDTTGSGGSRSGRVRVYQYIATPDGLKPKAWIQLGIDIDGEAALDRNGYSVSMNSAGDIVAIGAPDNTSSSGHVRVYQYIVNPLNDSTKIWSKLGGNIDGENIGDLSGFSVSMNSAGNIVAIGARDNDGNGDKSGHVRVYQYNGSSWGILDDDIDGVTMGDNSGYSVSMNSEGTIVAIGARNANINNSGHVRVWKLIDNTWQRLGQDLDGEAAGDNSGYSVSMNSAGDIVAIGAVGYDGRGGNSNSGHVRVWKLIDNKWERLGLDLIGEAAGDNSGISVSMNGEGDIVSIGAHFNNGNGNSSGHARVFYYRNGAWNQAPPGFFKVSDGTFTISDTGLFTVQ